jgi:hypothetical protein
VNAIFRLTDFDTYEPIGRIETVTLREGNAVISADAVRMKSPKITSLVSDHLRIKTRERVAWIGRTTKTTEIVFDLRGSFSAKNNTLEVLRSHVTTDDTEMLREAKLALNRIDQRAGEAIEQWADNLANDLGSFND